MIREQLQNTETYRQATGGAPATDGGTNGVAVRPTAGAGAVLSLEKSDLQFWMDVGKLVLLYLILRELRRGR